MHVPYSRCCRAPCETYCITRHACTGCIPSPCVSGRFSALKSVHKNKYTVNFTQFLSTRWIFLQTCPCKNSHTNISFPFLSFLLLFFLEEEERGDGEEKRSTTENGQVKLWLILKHTSWKNHTFSLSTQLNFFQIQPRSFFQLQSILFFNLMTWFTGGIMPGRKHRLSSSNMPSCREKRLLTRTITCSLSAGRTERAS